MSQAEHDLRMDYVEFPARNLEAVKKFYQDVFHWEFKDYGDEYTSFKDGRLAGGFRAASEAPPRGGSLIVLYAMDLEAVQAAVESHGGTITMPTFDFPGGRRFHFTDPAGNELGVWSDH
jgi:predicted enzyme related to lactoylglutathione lyase